MRAQRLAIVTQHLLDRRCAGFVKPHVNDDAARHQPGPDCARIPGFVQRAFAILKQPLGRVRDNAPGFKIDGGHRLFGKGQQHRGT